MIETLTIVSMGHAPIVPFFSGGVWEILGNSSLFGILILFVLIVMSLISWVIMANKYFLFKEIRIQTEKFQNQFNRSRQFSDLLGQIKLFRVTPLGMIYMAGIKEADAIMEAKDANAPPDQPRSRLNEDDFKTVGLMLDKAISESIGKVEKNVVFLATVANAAPFLGLLGTIVGVMESFWSIGERGSASLAVVAPGIAEALLVIVVGLAAAIPAVIGYNWANTNLKNLTDQANNFSLEFLARLKKDSYR